MTHNTPHTSATTGLSRNPERGWEDFGIEHLPPDKPKPVRVPVVETPKHSGPLRIGLTTYLWFKLVGFVRAMVRAILWIGIALPLAYLFSLPVFWRFIDKIYAIAGFD